MKKIYSNMTVQDIIDNIAETTKKKDPDKNHIPPPLNPTAKKEWEATLAHTDYRNSDNKWASAILIFVQLCRKSNIPSVWKVGDRNEILTNSLWHRRIRLNKFCKSLHLFDEMLAPYKVSKKRIKLDTNREGEPRIVASISCRLHEGLTWNLFEKKITAPPFLLKKGMGKRRNFYKRVDMNTYMLFVMKNTVRVIVYIVCVLPVLPKIPANTEDASKFVKHEVWEPLAKLVPLSNLNKKFLF